MKKGWTHCSKHNLDFPSEECCVLCERERQEKEMYEPDEDAMVYLMPPNPNSLWNRFKRWVKA